MTKNLIERSPAMDIVRCLALFLVVSVHFFLNNGFYSQVVKGPQMYIMVLIRSFCMICVPLFMTLSGYLMCNKKPDMKYYSKIIYTLTIYFLASVCCIFYKVYFLNENITVFDFLDKLLRFEAAPYAWYVEMYIGLFLLCPFLNIVYNNLKDKKQKQLLLITMIVLTSLPRVVNIFVFDGEWFLNPASSKEYFKILPSFWVSFYPITYYFVGCYMREFKLKYKSWQLGLMCLAVFFLNGSFNYYRSYGSKFISGGWQNYGSLFLLIQTVLVIAFIDSLNYSKMPKFASSLLKTVSGLCFGGYLLSWIFDKVFYKILKTNVPDVFDRMIYFFPAVLCIYICSLLLSYGINNLYEVGSMCISKIPKKVKKTETEQNEPSQDTLQDTSIKDN